MRISSFFPSLLLIALTAASPATYPARPHEGISEYVSRLSTLEQQLNSARSVNDALRNGLRAEIDGVRRLLDRYRADNVLNVDERRDLNQRMQAVSSDVARAR
jgi:hypothetical protein